MIIMKPWYVLFNEDTKDTMKQAFGASWVMNTYMIFKEKTGQDPGVYSKDCSLKIGQDYRVHQARMKLGTELKNPIYKEHCEGDVSINFRITKLRYELTDFGRKISEMQFKLLKFLCKDYLDLDELIEQQKTGHFKGFENIILEVMGKEDEEEKELKELVEKQKIRGKSTDTREAELL